MCHWIARRCAPGLPADDLEEVAAAVRVQFVRASRDFDPSRGLKFATYAMQVAEHTARRAARLIRARGVTVPSDHTIPVPAVGDLNAPLPEGDSGEFIDMIAAPEPPDQGPEIAPDFWERLDGPAGARLTDRQREVLALRYRDGLTLMEIGEQLGRSKELVRQTVAAALSKLQLSNRLRRLHEECRT